MDIEVELHRPRSSGWPQTIVDHIGNDPERFASLMLVLERGDFVTKQRAAWPMSIIAERNPGLAELYLSKLVDLLWRNDVHDAVKRSVLRSLQFVELPTRLKGKVFSHCIDLIADPREPIAVRCFAVTAASRIASGRKELMRELKLVSEMQLEHSSAGLKVRIRRLLTGM